MIDTLIPYFILFLDNLYASITAAAAAADVDQVFTQIYDFLLHLIIIWLTEIKGGINL